MDFEAPACSRLSGCPAEAAVDFKKLGNILAVIGGAVLAGAVAWWFVFYSNVVSELQRAPVGVEAGKGLRDVVSCLYSSDGICGLIATGANLFGKTPYAPVVFWVGLVGLVVGVVIRLAAKPAPKT